MLPAAAVVTVARAGTAIAVRVVVDGKLDKFITCAVAAVVRFKELIDLMAVWLS